MENKFCQSCGMPMTAEEQFGRNADGSKNGEYCSYCYRDGAFTEDCAMDEMILIKIWNILTREKRLVLRWKNSFPC